MPNKTSSIYKAIIWAGLLAGTLDIIAACTSTYLQTGKPPQAVFRYIASAVFGKSVKDGGVEMIVAGLVFHYLVAFLFTIAFFVLYPKLKFLSKHIVITGLIYGILAWCIMSLIVIPMSNAAQPAFTLQMVITGMLFLMFFIGLPVALLAKKHYSTAAKNAQ
jgi:uncharacterized membrane protein YagU involved in acid resistance